MANGRINEKKHPSNMGCSPCPPSEHVNLSMLLNIIKELPGNIYPSFRSNFLN